MSSKESTIITSSSIRAEIEEKKARIARLRAQRLQGRPRDAQSDVSSIPKPPAPVEEPEPVVKLQETVVVPEEKKDEKPEEPPKKPETVVELKVVVDQGVVDIVPKEIITYSKQTQTIPSISQPQQEDSSRPSVAVEAATGIDHEDEKRLNPPESSSKKADDSIAQEDNTDKVDESSKKPEKPVITILTEEEANSVGNSAQFTAFLNQTSRVIDRVISIDEKFPDVTVNYVTGERRIGGRRRRHHLGGPTSIHGAGDKDDLMDDSIDDGDDDDEGTGTKHIRVEEELKESRLVGSGRTVTCLNWSTVHQELVLAGFSAPSAMNDEFGDAGVVLVWSVPSTLGGAEYALTCQSEVMTAMFNPQQPQCVIGGTRAGQIVQWDMRVGSAPVAIRPPSRKTHSWPVYALSMTDPFSGLQRPSSAGMISSIFGQQDGGAKKGANMGTLASLSSDGRLCLWSLRNLVQPLECYKMPVDTSSKEVLSMTIPAYSESTYVVGCVDGSVMTYTAHGSKDGVIKMADSNNGHTGAVLSADFHPPSPSRPVSHVFLTASTDWTVKLWSALEPQIPPYVLKTFPRFGDAVFDVKWSPAMPSAFAAADGSGLVSLWDISSPSGPKDSINLQSPVTRLRWNVSGNKLVAGTSAGTVSVLGVSEKWCSSRVEDFASVNSVLSNLHSQQPSPSTPVAV